MDCREKFLCQDQGCGDGGGPGKVGEAGEGGREMGGTAAGTRLPLVPRVPREQWEHAVILGLERELGKVWG